MHRPSELKHARAGEMCFHGIQLGALVWSVDCSPSISYSQCVFPILDVLYAMFSRHMPYQGNNIGVYTGDCIHGVHRNTAVQHLPFHRFKCHADRTRRPSSMIHFLGSQCNGGRRTLDLSRCNVARGSCDDRCGLVKTIVAPRQLIDQWWTRPGRPRPCEG